MIGVGVNAALEALIQFVPDENAKEWLERANDVASMALDATLAGGVSTAAIAAKMVARELKDHVVPQGDAGASQIFDAVSTVSQAAVGGAGGAAALGISAATETAGSAARAGLQKAAMKAAIEMGTKVAGGGAGAAAGYAANGADGLQAGMQLGMSVASADVGEALRRGGGVAAGAAVGYAAADGDGAERLKAAQVGASFGSKLSSLATEKVWTDTDGNIGGVNADELAHIGLSDGVSLGGQSGAAAARTAAGQDAQDAFLDSASVGNLAAGQLGGARGGYSAEHGVQLATGIAAEPIKDVRTHVVEKRRQALEDAMNKHGASEELLGRSDGVRKVLGDIGKGLNAASSATSFGFDVGDAVEAGTLDYARQNAIRGAQPEGFDEVQDQIAQNFDLARYA